MNFFYSPGPVACFSALNLFKILLQLKKILIILDTKTQLMYLDQEQQGMIKRVLVMRQQHCGTPYQTMQGVFQLLGSSSFLSLTGISQKIVLVRCLL